MSNPATAAAVGLLPAFVGSPTINAIHNMDAMTLLKYMPSQSVNCIVTSPPYFGLRDYSIAGQYGLEETPQQFVAKLVELFREARRVLRDDGVMFLNLGDSYFGGGGFSPDSPSTAKSKSGKYGSKGALIPGHTRAGVQRAASYGTSDKEPEGYQDRGCLCGNLCDVCRVVYRNRKSHNDDLIVAMLTASLSAPNHEHKVSPPDHSPTLGLVHQEAHSEVANQDFARSQAHANEQLRAFLVSMIGESSPQLLGVCLLRDTLSQCLLCARSLTDYAQESVHTSGDSSAQYQRNSDTAPHDDQQPRHNQYIDKACEYCRNVSYSSPYIQPHCTTYNLKPKDLIGIPWRVAFGLQDDGWILRSDIIWHKPNPMPESVTDRPTKAHEYVFLFAKSQRYFYDMDAIREPISASSIERWGNDRVHRKNASPQGINVSSVNGEDTFGLNPDGRNKRSVWAVNTEPFSGAHFATFPTKLIEPMILAGCPVGGVVFDPFMGSGTTALVARKHGRDYIGSELNPDYAKIARDRLAMPYTPSFMPQLETARA
jgi:DNA modification methylase